MADTDSSNRLDRELDELLQGLRVILPGVTVLFAFLLTVPFTQRFGELDSVQRTVFYVAFLTACASLICLVGPGTLHRVTWRQHDKEHLLRIGNSLALAGTGFLSVTVACSVFVVSDMLYDRTEAIMAAAMTGIVIAAGWFGIGLVRRMRDPRSGTEPRPSR